MTKTLRCIGFAFPMVALSMVVSSCSSTPRGLPKTLPTINLHGSPSTPPHSLSHGEYPFDSEGGYMSAWAAEGERLAGRGPGSDSDITAWSKSHGGSVSRRGASASARKTSSSKSSGKKSSSGGSYTIKQGDTLSAIARKNGTTVAKIKAANGMKSDFIREGKTLKIPR